MLNFTFNINMRGNICVYVHVNPYILYMTIAFTYIIYISVYKYLEVHLSECALFIHNYMCTNPFFHQHKYVSINTFFKRYVCECPLCSISRCQHLSQICCFPIQKALHSTLKTISLMNHESVKGHFSCSANYYIISLAPRMEKFGKVVQSLPTLHSL